MLFFGLKMFIFHLKVHYENLTKKYVVSLFKLLK